MRTEKSPPRIAWRAKRNSCNSEGCLPLLWGFSPVAIADATTGGATFSVVRPSLLPFIALILSRNRRRHPAQADIHFRERLTALGKAPRTFFVPLGAGNSAQSGSNYW